MRENHPHYFELEDFSDMGKVQSLFGNGNAGAVSRSMDDIIISVKNAGSADIPFGAPVFMTTDGAVPFNLTTPQDFGSFLGFVVRVADKTPDTYPAGQFSDPPAGVWHAGDVMEVLVRGTVALPLNATGTKGGKVYIVKSSGVLTPTAGESGTTVELQNVRIRNPKDGSGCCEAVVNERNLI